jgi:hypothetical protein
MRRLTAGFILSLFTLGLELCVAAPAAPPAPDPAPAAAAAPNAAPAPGPNAALDGLTSAQVHINLSYKKETLAKVFAGIELVSGLDVEVNVPPGALVSIQTGEVTLKEALEQLARDYRLTYEVVGKNKLIVNAKK